MSCPSDATCKTCPWWKKLSQLGEFRDGECRKTSPISHPEAAHYAGFGNDLYGVWPQTNDDDWCGEHPDRKESTFMHAVGRAEKAEAEVERLRSVLIQAWYDHEYLWAKVAQESPDGTVEAWAKRGEA